MKKNFILTLFCLAALAGCGYQIGTSPYGRVEPLVLSVPVADNQSRYADLGPVLTRAVISRLDSAGNVTVLADAPVRLRLSLTGVNVAGGAWRPELSAYNLPSASASRVVNLTVEAALEGLPSEDASSGKPQNARRNFFNSSRSFYVSDDENQTRLLEEEAFAWVLDDLARKIVQNFFGEF